MAQVAGATFGIGSIPFFIIQAATACVLLLAANTAFNGFPLLGSVLARDGYAPKALNTRGDRLVFSNGMIILGIAAIGILIIYPGEPHDADPALHHRRVRLVLARPDRHGAALAADASASSPKAEEAAQSAVDTAAWTSLSTLPLDGPSAVASRDTPGLTPISPQTITRERRAAKIGLVINSVGATLTVFVLAIVTITKFTHGAYLVFIMIPILATLMIGVNRYYRDVEHEIQRRRRDALRVGGRRRAHPREPPAEAGHQGDRLRAGGHARQDAGHPHRGERGGVRGAPAAVGRSTRSRCRS